MTNISQKDNENSLLTGKKILYIITQTKFGGAQKYVLDLARYFGKNNEIHIAYGEKDNVEKKFIEQVKNLKIKTFEIPFLYRKIDLGRDYLAAMEILKIYNQEKYDLVHLNSSKVSLLGSLAAKMYSANLMNTRLRLIYTAHGFVFNEPLSKFKKKIYKFSEKVSTNIEHAIITVSEADRQSAIDNNITYERKMITIHNGIDIDNIHFYTREEALEKLQLDKNFKYFGTIASFYKTKGYPYLIEAVKILKEENSSLLHKHRWVLIGDGPEMDDIKKLIKDYNLEKYFKLLGAKDNAYKYLKVFDFFILPSVKEGLPYVILEAGLAKIPIIASRVGGIEEIITNEKTGLLTTAANPLSLTKAMRKIFKYNDMAEANYQNIKENFNLEKMLSSTENLYKKLF